MTPAEIQAFKTELKELLNKYNAHICFTCGEGSDTYGLYGEAITIRSGHPKSEEIFRVDGWTLGKNDI